MDHLWYSHTTNETFDDITVPTSRFIVQCNNDLTMNTQTFDESYGQIYEDSSEFYPITRQKNDDDYCYVDDATTYLIPNPLMISTNFVTHETNTNGSPSLSSSKKNLVSSIHSPTPSLVTDDEQDSQQTPFLYQVQIANEQRFNNQRQRLSPDFSDNYTKGSSTITDFQSPDLHDNLQNVPSQQLPSPVSPDTNGLGIVQITPPPSHQTTPKQKKRRFNRKHSLDNMSFVTRDQQTQQPSLNILTTTNPRDSTDHIQEYEICSDGKNSSSRRSSVSGTKRKAIDDSDETPEERRRKFLERNRIAASKCRQKKKAAMQELKERADTISSRNSSLHEFVNNLREELLTLKNQLLAHRNCSCNILQEYIRKDANTPTTATQTNQ